MQAARFVAAIGLVGILVLSVMTDAPPVLEPKEMVMRDFDADYVAYRPELELAPRAFEVSAYLE